MTDTAAKWSPAVVEELLFRQFIKNEDITAFLPAAPKVANDNYLEQYEQATKMLFAYVRNGPVVTLATAQQHGGNTPVVKPYQTPLKSFLARTPTPTAKTRSETRPNAAPPLVPTSSSSSSLSSAPTLPVSISNTNPLNNSIMFNTAASMSSSATIPYQQHQHQHQQQQHQHQHQQEEQVSNMVNNKNKINSSNVSATTAAAASPSLSALAPTAVPSVSSNDKIKELYSTATSVKTNNTGNVNNPVPSGLSNVPCVNTLLGSANNSASAANAMAKAMNARTLTPRPLSRASSAHKNVANNTPHSAHTQSHEPQVKRYRIDWPAEVPSNNALKSNSRTKVAHLTAQRVAAQESVDPDLIFAQNKGELPLKAIFAQFPKALQNIAEVRNASGD